MIEVNYAKILRCFVKKAKRLKGEKVKRRKKIYETIIVRGIYGLCKPLLNIR